MGTANQKVRLIRFYLLLKLKLQTTMVFHVFVKIEWSNKCVHEGDLKITKNQLKKTKWNPNVPVGGAWREDLNHKLMSKR